MYEMAAINNTDHQGLITQSFSGMQSLPAPNRLEELHEAVWY